MLVAQGIDEIPGAAVLIFDQDLRHLMVRGGAVRDNTQLVPVVGPELTITATLHELDQIGPRADHREVDRRVPIS